jgi:hypothetical protein
MADSWRNPIAALRRVILTTAALMAMLPAMWWIGAKPAAARGDLRVEASQRYQIADDGAWVRVTATYTLTNNATSTRSGNIITSYFFTGFTTVAHSDAQNISVTSSSGGVTYTAKPLPAEDDEEDDDSGATSSQLDRGVFGLLELRFNNNLNQGQRRTITIEYDLLGSQPRSKEFSSRVNAAYVSFSAIATGDPGLGSLTLDADAAWQADLLGTDLERTTVDGRQQWSATAIAEPFKTYVYVTARRDSGLAAVDVSVAASRFSIRSWPNDPEWAAFARNQVETGIPALEGLIGRSWPETTNVTEVVEAYTPYLYGYAGWYNPQSDKTEIGERLDSDVFLHELSHAWFNREWFTERWISEGLANVYAYKAAKQLGFEAEALPTTVAGMSGNNELNDWGSPSGRGTADRDTEAYGYAAASLVMNNLVTEIGDDKMRAVLEVALAKKISYKGLPEREDVIGGADWTRFYDLLVEVGGSSSADQIFRNYVLSGNQLSLLLRRTESRARYGTLDTAADGWAMPFAVRRPMADWSFEIADSAMADATNVLDRRNTLRTDAATISLTVPEQIKPLYELATVNFDEANAAIDTTDAALKVLIDAHGRRAAATSRLQRLGLWKSDVDIRLAAADAAFSAGDAATATSGAQGVITTVDAARSLGKTRATWIGVAIGAPIVLLLATTLLVRRRRKRRRASVQEDDPDSVAPDSVAPAFPPLEAELDMAAGTDRPTPGPATPLDDLPSTPVPDPLPVGVWAAPTRAIDDHSTSFHVVSVPPATPPLAADPNTTFLAPVESTAHGSSVAEPPTIIRLSVRVVKPGETAADESR